MPDRRLESDQTGITSSNRFIPHVTDAEIGLAF